MTIDNTIEFIPEGGSPTQDKKWGGLFFVNGFMLIAWYLIIHYRIPYDATRAWLFLIFLILGPIDISILFFSTEVIKVTLFKDTGIFQYDYTDFFGEEKTRTIYLKTAYYKYKADVTKTSIAMRLLIYNNYFKNQVVIKANEKMGFNRAQLDTIVEGIKEIQAGLKTKST